jgi:hypothetical protein
MSKTMCCAAIKCKDHESAKKDLEKGMKVFLINEFEKTYAYKQCLKPRIEDGDYCTVHEKVSNNNPQKLKNFKNDILPHAKLATSLDTFFSSTSEVKEKKVKGEKVEKKEKHKDFKYQCAIPINVFRETKSGDNNEIKAGPFISIIKEKVSDQIGELDVKEITDFENLNNFSVGFKKTDLIISFESEREISTEDIKKIGDDITQSAIAKLGSVFTESSFTDKKDKVFDVTLDYSNLIVSNI